MGNSNNTPFKALKGLKVKKKQKVKAAKPAPAPEPEKEPENEEDMFARAMLGVKTVDGRKGGRDLAPAAKPKKHVPADPDEEARAQLFDLVNGRVEFELEHTTEYAQGFVRGLDSKIFRRLKAGRLSPEAHLDLHGLNADQAKAATLHFLRENYLKSRRCLLLIPGRGVNSPGGYPVLKKELETWLTRDPLRRIVLAFCTALPKHGGAGAMYVLLRKNKKTKGKIRWESFWDAFE